ncbi:3-isopropylmalate dehydratase large subunit [Enhygromyxa salina]|uniref:3-isopropylmalate dehydratase large subunit n=1 Tax=Enhygromyxa salina TaxID=215803 RepID=A0A0C2DAI7_9BACT|nr:aconitase family protein [Enhygromyxa salina]KIG16902.1 3-isopropylmalate dehydratase large subunit [Enhygromyxa salina]
MQLTGRILWLTEDTAQLEQQLAGANPQFDPQDPPDLHFGVNTDAMINGAACTLGYTGEILGPYFLQNFKDSVEVDAVKQGGFQVVVGGDAYGSGSSREVAVVAHQGAGVELVIARSFQRIFQENMVYAGLPFTTDFGVVTRLRNGEDIDIAALGQALPPFFRAVSEAGGLMRYGTHVLAGDVGPTYEVEPAPRPMNCIEKIVAAKAWRGKDQPFGIAAVAPGDQILCEADFRGMHEYTGGMVMNLYAQEWADAPIHQPELAAAFEDHFVLIDRDTVPLSVKSKRLAPAQSLAAEMIEACERNGIRVHGPGRLKQGVCHRIVVEDYARPGDIIVLTDSHTPTAGVMNAFAFGVGSTAMAFALRTGMIPVTVPKTVRIWVEGDAKGVLSPKDLVLHLIGDPYFREEHWRESPTDTCVIQLGGPGLDQWNVDELSVITNMTVEGGLMTGIVEPCAPIREFLQATRGQDYAERLVAPDEGATYVKTIHVNLDEVPLTVATPGDSRNRKPLTEVGDVAIHNIVIASCTGGSLSDLRAAAQVLRGRKLAEKVRVTVTPSSAAVADDARKEGLLSLFSELGAVVTDPGCGSCIGNGPGIPYEGETTASTTNRNFDRRMGAPGPVYLVSPAIAAACAVTGKLTDPRSL